MPARRRAGIRARARRGKWLGLASAMTGCHYPDQKQVASMNAAPRVGRAQSMIHVMKSGITNAPGQRGRRDTRARQSRVATACRLSAVPYDS
jgi:hypothetical protein